VGIHALAGIPLLARHGVFFRILLGYEDRLLAYFLQFSYGAQRLPFAICCIIHRVCWTIFISLAPLPLAARVNQ
jgi:hypothetical protein